MGKQDKNTNSEVGIEFSKTQKVEGDSKKTSYQMKIIGAGTLLAIALSPVVMSLLEGL